MKEEIKITIAITDDNIVLYGENMQDLTEDDIIDINKMLGGLARTSSILQEGDPTNGNAQIRHRDSPRWYVDVQRV